MIKMNSTCPICNDISDKINNYSNVVCKSCFICYGTLDKYQEESMTFFIHNNAIYSEINGIVGRELECTISKVSCCAKLENNEIIFVKTIPIKETLSFKHKLNKRTRYENY